MPRPSRSRSSSNEASPSRERKRQKKSRRHRRDSRSRRPRSHTRDSSVKQALSTIITRLNAIEESTASVSRTPVQSIRDNTPQRDELDNSAPTAAKALADALIAIRTKPQNYYVSNFDPAIHNFEVWCDEVERARLVNQWTDLECLSRVANCLKGDARSWLNEWTTSDRSWSNFSKQFMSLCPRKLDYANILFEVINTTSE